MPPPRRGPSVPVNEGEEGGDAEHDEGAPGATGTAPAAIARWRSARHGAGPLARRRRVAGTPTGSRPPAGATRWTCSRSRPRPACPSWCRSATGACSRRPSPSIAGRRAIMAADLADTPTGGVPVQLCGDAHLSNFGFFASPERSLIFERQRLRRDPARPVGVGREALRRQLRDRGPRARASDAERRAVVAGTVAVVPPARCASSPRCATSRSGTRTPTWTADPEPARRRRPRGARPRRSRSASPRRAQRTACAPLDASTHRVDGELRILADPPLVVPIEDLVKGRRPRGDRVGHRRDHRRLPPHAPARPAARCWTATATSTLPARWWAWAASARAPGSSSSWGATTGPARSPGQGGPALGARALRRRAASSPTRASAWWRASA